ncbi:Uncharacterised protein [uncultured archaeon]|nr:Uncharacterised protein [uncultured archaeon]
MQLKKHLNMIKRPLKIAAYAGLALLIIAIVSNIISQVTTYYNVESTFLNGFFVLIGWIELVLSIFFTYGFIILGRKYKSKLLVVMSWITIVLIVLLLLSSFVGTILKMIKPVSAADSSINTIISSADSSNPNLLSNLTPEQEKLVVIAFIITWIAISIILGILSILWGIGLLNLGKNVKYAKTSGILNIVAGATYIAFIGFLIQLIAFIFEIVLLFKISKKLEK